VQTQLSQDWAFATVLFSQVCRWDELLMWPPQLAAGHQVWLLGPDGMHSVDRAPLLILLEHAALSCWFPVWYSCQLLLSWGVCLRWLAGDVPRSSQPLQPINC
jgi:hypothetical protein